MVITGTGGTDYYPSSKSTLETIVVMVLVLCGAILWTQILADFCDVATNGDPAGLRFRQTLDEINLFISLHGLPQDMQMRMREYLHAQRNCQMRLETAKSISALSPSLQVEVIMYVHQTLFDKIWYLRHVEPSICVQLALKLNSSVMAPGELASLRRMYIIERGMVLYAGKVLTSGKLWGVDDIILTAGLLKYERLDRARTMSYVEYRELSRDDFMEVVANEPMSQRLFRKLAILVALRRFMIAQAASVRSSPGQEGRGSTPNLLSAMNSAANLQTLREYDRLQATERVATAVAAATFDQSSIGSAASGKALEEVHHSLTTLTTAVAAIASAVSDMQRQLSHLEAHPRQQEGGGSIAGSSSAQRSCRRRPGATCGTLRPSPLVTPLVTPLGNCTRMASCKSVSVVSPLGDLSDAQVGAVLTSPGSGIQARRISRDANVSAAEQHDSAAMRI